MAPDALQPKAYLQILVFSRSYLHGQVSPSETLVVKGGTTWARNGRWILLENTWLPRNIHGSFTCHKSTTWDERLYSPSKGKCAEDFFALKNPTASAGFEPANLGTKGQHATSRPLKPLKLDYSPFIFLELLASLWMKQIGLAIESCCVGALKLETESIYSWESRSLESDKLGEKFCTHVSPKLQTYDRLLVFHHLSKYVRKIKYLVLGVNKKRNSIPMKNYSKLFIVLS